MAKTPPVEEPALSVAPAAPMRLATKIILGIIVALIAVVASFELVYAGKVYPGVSANGAYVGGLTQTSASSHATDKATAFSGDALALVSGNSTLHIPVNGLGVSYDAGSAARLAYSYGREGSLITRIHQQLRALLGRPTSFNVYTFSDDRLSPYILQLDNDTSTPVSDASLSFTDSGAQVIPATSGTRLDLGRLTMQIADHLATTDASDINVPTYQLPAQIDTVALSAGTGQASTYVAAPITLTYNGTTKTIDQNTIISWLKVAHHSSRPFMDSLDVADLYPVPPTVTLSLDPAAVTAYVAALAGQIDQAATDAQLSMAGGQLTVVTPSQTGIKLDQTAAAKAIMAVVTQSASDRSVALSLTTAQAAVREDNLADLGITGLISEGETYFPGSPSTRLINVRAGAKKFNNVLLAPGEQFSFGKLLGEVDASTGYVPELVILGDHEEKQYGGGLCQVSSTAFRAALAAGLPIDERVNHAFAISYYTWPYTAPGVDATIYYPDVDLKFTNDTGHYILIQTIMNGVDLKFDFYGTKTKSGNLRGPYFVTGTNDATQPSHTVFYRDVMDLNGNVVKTDTFNTYYKPSTDFPVTKQFN